MRILVLTTEPVSADQLRAELPGAADPRQAEVMVLAPALHESALRFWMSDADSAIARAEAVRRATLQRLSEEGIAATADTGEADMTEAIEDGLKSFPADHILVFAHAEGERRYREDVDPAAIEARFRIPVTRAEVGASGSRSEG